MSAWLWVPTLVAAVAGFSAGHFRLKAKILRRLSGLSAEQHSQLQAAFRSWSF